ncbi:MAG: AAA family ATPase [Deltaproteobacteria bacterium]|nr:AAA family ATPase [Deltaproteobacteria bacterium]
MPDATSFSFPPFRLDVTNQLLWHGEQVILLRPKTLAVLRHFVEHVSQLVSRADLSQAAWGTTHVSPQVLRVSIRELRQALGDTTTQPRFLETVGQQGWRFIAKVVSSQHSVASRKSTEARISPQDSALRTQHSVLVGRETELTQLHGWLAKALQGERQIVFVTGEPGIGKTTLVDAFVAQLADDPTVSSAHGQCIEHYGTGEAYLPVLAALEQLCSRQDDTMLLDLLRRYAPLWLAQMPSLLEPAELADLQRQLAGTTRERMLREFAVLLEVVTAQQPLVVVLEDLHWVDPSTVELLAYLARRREPARVLVLGVYRPTEVLTNGHPLQAALQELRGHRLCQDVALEGFSEPAVAAYLETRVPAETSKQTPPHQLTLWLHQRTDGHPFFLVHLVDDLLERGLLHNTAQGWVLSDRATQALMIPTTVRQLLERQLEKLAAAERQVLAAASMAGAEFSAAAVAAAVEDDAATVEEQCEELVRRQAFLCRAGIAEWPDGTVAACYRFAHALSQQMWHEQVAVTRQQQWHQRIGQRKEAAYGDRAGEIAAELAVHFEQGREYQHAIRYFGLAGRNAMQRHAPTEAIHYLAQGLDLLKTLPETQEHTQQELELQISLGLVLVTTKGFTLPEVKHTYTRAHELCRRIGNTPQLFPVLEGLHSFYAVRGEYQTALALGEQMLALAQGAQNPSLLLEAHHVLGDTLVMSGESWRARVHLEQGLALYDRQQHRFHALLYSGHDPGVCCLSYLAFALWFLGYPDQALRRSQQALSLAQEGNHPYSTALALHLSAYFHQLRREISLTQTQAEATLTLSTAQEFPYWTVLGTIMLGWTRAAQQQSQTGIAQIQGGLAACRAMGAEVALSGFLACLAEAQKQTGQIEEGLATIDEALAHIARTGECYYEAEIYRLKGELLLARARSMPKERRKATNSRI